MQRKIRVLVGKPGLDGHDRGAKVVAAALRDAGMEVIYTGLHQTPEQVVDAAVQEDVDVVALSVLSGAHMTLFPEILELMRARGVGDRLLTGGGIIPNDDMTALAGLGVGRLFGPGTNTQDIVGYIRSWYAGVHGEAALPPLPPPPSRPEPMVGAGERPTPRPAGPRAAATARTARTRSASRAKPA
jgi:methylmalonyl-CoA mutase C-terminal domain/subunit